MNNLLPDAGVRRLIGIKARKAVVAGIFRKPKGEEIGELDDLIVGKDKVLVAIIQVGGSRHRQPSHDKRVER